MLLVGAVPIPFPLFLQYAFSLGISVLSQPNRTLNYLFLVKILNSVHPCCASFFVTKFVNFQTDVLDIMLKYCFYINGALHFGTQCYLDSTVAALGSNHSK